MTGFFLSYGIFEEYYHSHWTLSGSRSITGVIGNVQAGVMYLSMPVIFGLFTKRYARYRRTAAIGGVIAATASFIGSSFSRSAWQLVTLQGIVAALGCALLYSCTTFITWGVVQYQEPDL
jgi:hypothetical protein